MKLKKEKEMIFNNVNQLKEKISKMREDVDAAYIEKKLYMKGHS